jgi:hypothetical protein
MLLSPLVLDESPDPEARLKTLAAALTPGADPDADEEYRP